MSIKRNHVKVVGINLLNGNTVVDQIPSSHTIQRYPDKISNLDVKVLERAYLEQKNIEESRKRQRFQEQEFRKRCYDNYIRKCEMIWNNMNENERNSYFYSDFSLN